MRVVVTGGAGFIGSHLGEALLAAGREVTLVDNFDDFYAPGRKRANVAATARHPRGSVLELDTRDRVALRRAFEGVDAVVHLAARAGVRPSFDDAELYADVNVAGTRSVLEAAAAAGVARVVFASSSSVYGAGATPPFSEAAGLGRPKSPYASTKVEGEQLCRSFAARFRHVAVLRLFTVYGPRQRPDLALHGFARRIVAGEPIPVFGSLSSFRDYTFVWDAVRAIERALHVDDPWLLVNVGSGRPVALGRMISTLEAALGVPARRTPLPAHPADLVGTMADIRVARERLGWRPTVGFEEGVEAFVRWFREQAPDVEPAPRPEPTAA